MNGNGRLILLEGYLSDQYSVSNATRDFQLSLQGFSWFCNLMSYLSHHVTSWTMMFSISYLFHAFTTQPRLSDAFAMLGFRTIYFLFFNQSRLPTHSPSGICVLRHNSTLSNEFRVFTFADRNLVVLLSALFVQLDWGQRWGLSMTFILEVNLVASLFLFCTYSTHIHRS